MKVKMYQKIMVLVGIALIIAACVAWVTIHNGSKEAEIRLQIEDDCSSEMSIPDPSQSNGIVNIKIHPVLHPTEHKNRYDEEIESIYERHKVDLSFLGLKEKAYIINYAKDQLDNSEKDNCLALTLGTGIYNSETEEYENAYLAVLDYKNKKSYLIQTGQMSGNVDQLNKYDLTGDGKNEWIVSGVANEWLEWNAYRIKDEKLDEVRCKYSDYYDGPYVNYIQDAFDEKFIAYDKIRIRCKDADFKKVINVGDTEYLDHQTCLLSNDFNWVETDWPEEMYDYFQNIDPEKGICIPLDLEVGHGTICAKMNAYLKYNKDTDMIEIDRIGDFREVRE